MKKVGITAGAFDLPHAGHMLMFQEARAHCDCLIVLLQTNPTIDRPEKNKPIMSLYERYTILRSVKYIDKIIVYETESDLYLLLKDLKPDIRFIGSDWKDKEFTGKDLPIEIYFNKRDHGFSTSELRKRVCA